MNRPLSLITCLLVPFVILLIGLIFAGAFAYKEFPKMISENGRGPIPPGFDVSLPKPAEYTVWLHTYTIFEGTAYEHSGKPPSGATVVIIDKATGDKISVQPLLITATKASGNDTATAIGRFETYRETNVEVLGTGFGDTTIISIAETKLAGSLKTVVIFLSIIIFTLFLSILFLIVLLHRRQRMLALEAMR